MAAIDPDLLLCEHCGYPIDGLAATAPCPECGTPCGRSWPQARPGSAWQIRPTARSLGTTAWRTLRHPADAFGVIRPTLDRRTRLLLGIYFGAATGLATLLWVVYNMRHPVPGFWYVRSFTNGFASGQAVLTTALPIPHSLPWAILAVPALLVTLYLLTWIEALGVQFFGRRRGWRVTAPIAWSVCAHASVGWVVGGLLYALSPVLARMFHPLLDLLTPATALMYAMVIAQGVPLSAFLVGMVVFETLVYIGVRACRFANVARPHSSASTA